MLAINLTHLSSFLTISRSYLRYVHHTPLSYVRQSEQYGGKFDASVSTRRKGGPIEKQIIRSFPPPIQLTALLIFVYTRVRRVPKVKERDGNNFPICGCMPYRKALSIGRARLAAIREGMKTPNRKLSSARFWWKVTRYGAEAYHMHVLRGGLRYLSGDAGQPPDGRLPQYVASNQHG
jgi:hypothetical protein